MSADTLDVAIQSIPVGCSSVNFDLVCVLTFFILEKKTVRSNTYCQTLQ